MSLLDEKTKCEIAEKMIIALDNTDLRSVFSISREQSLRNSIRHQNRTPEQIKRKKQYDMDYRRKERDSSIPLGSPSTQISYHRSKLEEEYENDIKEFFPGVRFNQFPHFLYNPLSEMKLEADALCTSNSVIIEVHEKPHKKDRGVQIRDYKKKIIIDYRGWDLIILDETMRENVQHHLKQQWEKILEKRLSGF